MNQYMTMKIQKAYVKLRPSEKKVADFLMGFTGRFEGLGLVEICENTGVSQPTVLRFTKALGYDGYKDFKIALVREQVREEEADSGEQEAALLYGFKILPEDNLETIPGKVIGTSMGMLRDTLKSVSLKEYKGAVSDILKAKRIVIFGVEDSTAAAQDLMVKLMYLGLNCSRHDDYYMQNVNALSLTKDDLAIGISYSGRSSMTLELMKRAKKKGAMTLVITNFSNTPLRRYGDHVLCTSSEQTLYGDAVFSRVAQLCLVDMLYMGIINSDYERFQSCLKKNGRMAAEQACRMPGKW